MTTLVASIKWEHRETRENETELDLSTLREEAGNIRKKTPDKRSGAFNINSVGELARKKRGRRRRRDNNKSRDRESMIRREEGKNIGEIRESKADLVS